MPTIITCARCGKMESWSPGKNARTHCRFCQTPLSGSELAAAPTEHQKSGKTSPLLKATLSGGFGGAGLVVSVTLIFNALPMLMVVMGLIAYDSLAEPQRELILQAALNQLVNLAVSAAAGFAFGSLVMAAAHALLGRRPDMVRLAGLGAMIGACLAVLGVLVGHTMPAALERGFNDPQLPAKLQWQWLLSLVLAAAGSVIGLALLVALATRPPSQPRAEPEPAADSDQGAA